ncbi:MAG TPA: hypothetical protein DEF39_12265 [Hungateiclostridium thermocellum]|uniref:Uncharacterized protein n=3 Tax=Acetivibrio TaxID=35829 RepID=A0A2S8R6W4_9FIRM|nr:MULTISPECIES: hypothetical protein [Acetivibrio]CDG37616.1 hypothetical protein CTHBC1_3057 [Acetivibrio thermocellus BC1]ABN54330.1 hypothetical protein Cthe_3135 [Acetivibrio thermocellus ATCC 27405]ADU73767.1 hypothetical protein Clo1313_0688 [Acetivibrio thermocellus DSM 1313]ALX07698.1 hypothetical protein AD2_00700 [Acetivibrio thermocellus AD2]ANV75440.1 hypothetical protein LQRI_0699 [Acetivibrio thermocellus DSM 2360]
MEILRKNRINEPCIKLNTHSIANKIYATENYIIGIPTDHPDEISDAFTKSVAALLAKSNGIRTPELICFDDSYTIKALDKKLHKIGKAEDGACNLILDMLRLLRLAKDLF